jgi:hypothetical protein
MRPARRADQHRYHAPGLHALRDALVAGVGVTPADVRARVEDIARDLGDTEVDHADEDLLYFDLLTAIATGNCTDPQQCAVIALETQNLIKDRWYA